MLDNLKKYNLLLASKSPRRRELLGMLDVPFGIAPAIEVDEVYPSTLPAHEIPEYLAKLKASAYQKLIKDNELIITADTVVILGDRVLGKPENAAGAKRMLQELSGREHTVVTGVALSTAYGQRSFSVDSRVKFAEISETEAEYYVDRYNPLDKAGSYGIQEWIGAVAVEAISGSFYNVMGLPVHQLYKVLKEM